MSCLRLSKCLFKFRSDEVYERNQPRFQVYFYNNNNEFQQHCMSKSLLRNTTRTHVSFSNKNNNNHFLDNDLIEEEEEEEEDRKLVHCEVEVISWRERRIKAQISIHARIQSVWNALTDYERLADYIPNLVSRFLLYYYYYLFYIIGMCLIILIILNALERERERLFFLKYFLTYIYNKKYHEFLYF